MTNSTAISYLEPMVENAPFESYREALTTAISALREQEQRQWIPVTKRFPPYNHDVLVYRPNMAMKIVVDSYDGYYGEDDNEWYEGWAKYGNDIHGKPIITHWMPLPPPPKGE